MPAPCAAMLPTAPSLGCGDLLPSLLPPFQSSLSLKSGSDATPSGCLSYLITHQNSWVIMMGNQVGYPTKSCPQLSEGICSQAGPAPELQPWQLHGGAFPPSQWAHAQPGIFHNLPGVPWEPDNKGSKGILYQGYCRGSRLDPPWLEMRGSIIPSEN